MRRLAELTSFGVGAAAALGLLVAWQVPGGKGAPLTSIAFGVEHSQTMQLSRTGTLFDVPRLHAGRPLSTSLRLESLRKAPLHVRPRIELDGDDALAQALDAEVLVDGEQLYRGPLQGLSERRAQRTWLRPRAHETLTVRLALPRGEAEHAAGRALRAVLRLEVEP